MTTTKAQYKYNDKTYSTNWGVRQAIQENENKKFGPEPTDSDPQIQLEKRVEFWAGHNVEYSEQPIDQQTLDQQLATAKTVKKNQITRDFDSQLQSSSQYITSSVGFDVNVNINSMMTIQALLATTSEDQTINFRGYDNIDHQITYQELETINNEVNQWWIANFQKLWSAKQSINDATTVEQVNAVML